jgi:hypothetical protein
MRAKTICTILKGRDLILGTVHDRVCLGIPRPTPFYRVHTKYKINWLQVKNELYKGSITGGKK